MKKLLAVLVLLFGFSQAANAGFLLEPYIGYNGGKFDAKSSLAGNFSDAFTGVGIGARVGWTLPIFWVAADYMMGSGWQSQLAAEGGGELKANSTRFGVTIGADLPVLPLNIFGGYVTSAKFATDDFSLEGSGLKAGVGLGFLPLVQINLEYLMLTYDDKDGASTALNDLSDAKETALFLSLSLPLDL